MIPGDTDTHDTHPRNQSPLTNVSNSPSTTASTTKREGTIPDPKAGTSLAPSELSPMTIPLDIPPRPSTAPPQPDAIKGQTSAQTRTTLVSNLRARNLLLQKAISHIDDAVLHLMAARSGVPSAKIQQVRYEARDRKDLLDRVDKAIKMAQNGELQDEIGGKDRGEGAESLSMSPNVAGAGVNNTAPGAITPSPLDPAVDGPQLRRSSSHPQLSPSAPQTQIPTQVYTLSELVERRKTLQESIQSWKNYATELRAVQPQFEALAQAAEAAVIHASPATATASSTTQEPIAVKLQRAQFEIKRREELLLRLNQAIAQLSHPNSQEQFAALATYVPPALDKPRFDMAYAHFCKEKSIEMNTTIVMPDVAKPVIDLYSLHAAVMQEGSFTRVSARKSWDLVGGRLGFVETATTATEPARCSSATAAHLERAYRDRLQLFDHLYVSSIIETVRKRMAAEQQKKP